MTKCAKNWLAETRRRSDTSFHPKLRNHHCKSKRPLLESIGVRWFRTASVAVALLHRLE